MGGADLTDLRILAVQTGKVATCCGNAETSGSGIKMEQRFFFDRINMYSTRITICHGVQLAISRNAIVAKAQFSVFQRAFIGTDEAFNTPGSLDVVHGLPFTRSQTILPVHCQWIHFFPGNSSSKIRASYMYRSASFHPDQPMPALSRAQCPRKSSSDHPVSAATCGRNVPLWNPFFI